MEHEQGTGVILEEEVQETTKLYPRWKVLFHNDDKTPMTFVVYALIRYFAHTRESATEVMFEAHETGLALAGIYAKEQAEFKRDQVVSDARGKGYPLFVSIEKE